MTEPLTEEARAQANLQGMLQPDVPSGLEQLLTGLRPFTAATLALMQQTRNEWLRRVPVEEMDGHFLATLSWLYIQAAPETEVRRVVFVPVLFRDAVLAWGANITPAQLAAADAIIQHTLDLVDAAKVSVEDKPSDPVKPGTPKGPQPPPNS